MHWIHSDLERLVAKEVSYQGRPGGLLEIPKDRSHGDLTTSACLTGEGPSRTRGWAWAQEVEGSLHRSITGDASLSRSIEKVEAVRPGFINFFLKPSYLKSFLPHWIQSAGDLGPLQFGNGERVVIEFVSANPTGPLTIAHGRQAAVGDTLARLLQRAGFEVTKEYYLNDVGNQMRILGASLFSHYLEACGRPAQFPDDGYKGGYLRELAQELYRREEGGWLDSEGAQLERFTDFAASKILQGIREDLEEFDVRFDVWFSEKKLHAGGAIAKVLDRLRQDGWLYEAEGALWLKSTRAGDDKDRVVRKSDGGLTYLAADIAYHQDKFARGFNRLINILGPDHHGYVPRLKASVESLGFSKDQLSVIIVQLTTLFRNGQPVRMSTREGEFVTLHELVREVGRDAARFFFLMRRSESPLDFDLELAKSQSQANPVYYLQYAHTRIASLGRFAGALGEPAAGDFDRLEAQEETELMRLLWQYPYLLVKCAELLAPHLVTVYLKDLAQAFHTFYDRHRVVSDDASLTRARLGLARAVQAVLKDGLGILGVTAPEKM
ncbi:MAG: arginine--tRNA ligase [Candidatus Omnitrophica bacterium]|nr:arginine--tRNA ligase [Candidatus Omnitrophota bacterium]